MIVAVHAAGESDARSGRDTQLGLGAAAGGEVVAAVDDGGGEGAMVEDGPRARAPDGAGGDLEEVGGVVAEGFEAVAPFEQVLALVEQPFEFDRLEFGAVLLGLTAPLRLLVVVESALDAVDLAMEEVDDRPEEIGQIFFGSGIGQHRAEGVEDFGELGLRHFRLRQRPRVGLALAGAVTVEREVVEDMRGRRSGVMFVVGVGVEAGEQGVGCHMRVLSLQSTAPIAAFTGDLLPEAEPPWTRSHLLVGWQGPKRSGG
jgi:hypothetical protein